MGPFTLWFFADDAPNAESTPHALVASTAAEAVQEALRLWTTVSSDRFCIFSNRTGAMIYELPRRPQYC